MKVPPQSERPVTEEDEQDFLTPTSRRKKRALAARRAALRPWAMGIGLTVLVAVAAVGAYTLGASIGSWNDRPSTAATPTAHPAPMPSASSEPPMSGGYAIGPDGVLVRPAEFAADTYTKPELPEAAKENSERGAEAAAEHYLAVATYAWNTGDTAALAALSDDASGFAQSLINKIDNDYSNGWVYGKSLTVFSWNLCLPMVPMSRLTQLASSLVLLLLMERSAPARESQYVMRNTNPRFPCS